MVGVLGSARLAVDGARAGGRPPRCWPATASCSSPPRRWRASGCGPRSCAPGSRRSCWPSCTATRRGRRCPTRARGSSRSRGRRPRARCSCSRARRSSRSPRPRCGRRSPRAGAIRPPPGGSSACRRWPSRCSGCCASAPSGSEVGDPASEEAEVGPLRSPEDLAARRGARRGGGRGRRRARLRRPGAGRGPGRRVLRARGAAARAGRRADPARARARPGAGGRRGGRRGRRDRARPGPARDGRPPRPRQRRQRLGARPREGRARRPHARRRADLGQRARRRRARPGAAAAAPRRPAPGRLPARRCSAAERAACRTTRRSFGPEPPPRGWPTAARRTVWRCCAATRGRWRGRRCGSGPGCCAGARTAAGWGAESARRAPC